MLQPRALHAAFLLYDFLGLVGSPTISSTLAANGFSTFSKQNLGITPATIVPPDSASIANLTFLFTRATPIDNAAGGMNLFLGQFSLVSSFGPASSPNMFYAAATQRSDDSLLANNVSQLVGQGCRARGFIFTEYCKSTCDRGPVPLRRG
jgi:hypothetical protein